jgi:hypothetical protein
MTTPGMQGEVSPESIGKTAFSAVGGPSDAKPAPSGAAERTVDPNRLKPCKKRSSGLCGVGSGESKRKSQLECKTLV